MITQLGPRRITGVVAGAGALLLAGCTASPQPSVPGVPNAAAAAVRLVSFDTCEQALNDLKAAAEPHVTAHGLAFEAGGVLVAEPLRLEMRAEEMPVPDAATGDAPAVGLESEALVAPDAAAAPGTGTERAGAADPGFSGANVHEAGADEPDLVKTDGRRLVVLQEQQLRVVDLGRRQLTGTLDLPGAAEQMLLAGDRLLVVGHRYEELRRPVNPSGLTRPVGGVELVLVDLAGAPTVVERLKVDGSYADARLVDSTARVVLRSTPRFPVVFPGPDRSEHDALQENLRIVEESTIDDWVPRFEHVADGRERSGRLVGCTDINHSQVYSGAAMLSVVSIDLDRGLEPTGTVSVLGDGQTVYATGDSLYIADGGRWLRGAGGTEVHKFDIGGSGQPEYRASGAVEGRLLNQYAMSEYDGHLRIATTTEDPGQWRDGGVPDSESQVVVLAERDGALSEVGQLGGLGQGERIYAVRFLGQVGYVVTFREVDPLYTVDLSDPTNPRVLGELKIPGYSAYLHPGGEDRLLGVGQDATEEGWTTGTQVSLFDVSDLTAPRRIDAVGVEGAWSEVEHDPHAFLYWPPEKLVVVPFRRADQPVPMPLPEPQVDPALPEPEAGRALPEPQVGPAEPMPMPVPGEGLVEPWLPTPGEALVLRLEGDAFTEIGTVAHPVESADLSGPVWTDTSVRRSLVVGDELWTVSAAGVMASDVRDLAEHAWIPFR